MLTNLESRSNLFVYTAFHARMTGNTAPTDGQTVQFGIESLDIGNGYNPSISIYTAPQAGTYTFTWTISIYQSNYYITELVVNTLVKHQMMTSSYGPGSNSLYYQSTSATTVTQLNAGDRVFIRVYSKSGSPTIKSNTEGYSTFSGWMLH